MKTFLTALLCFHILPLATAQIHDQHPYRQIILRTRVEVESSRQKEASYRYSPWGNLSSSDRRYTQKTRLNISVANVSGAYLKGIRAQYRIYKRDLTSDTYRIAASGELPMPIIKIGEAKILSTDQATCQYHLRWSRLVSGNRLSRSGEKYAGYVVIYYDSKGPVCWDMSSQTMYAQYATELREANKLETTADSSQVKNITSPPDRSQTTVYVARTGRKFHRKDCRYVRNDAYPMVRADALKAGHTPCSVCKP